MNRLTLALQALCTPAPDPLREQLEAALTHARAELAQVRAELEASTRARAELEASLREHTPALGRLCKLVGTTDLDVMHGTVMAWKMSHERLASESGHYVPKEVSGAITRLIDERNRLWQQLRSIGLCPVNDWYGVKLQPSRPE